MGVLILLKTVVLVCVGGGRRGRKWPEAKGPLGSRGAWVRFVRSPACVFTPPVGGKTGHKEGNVRLIIANKYLIVKGARDSPAEDCDAGGTTSLSSWRSWSDNSVLSPQNAGRKRKPK